MNATHYYVPSDYITNIAEDVWTENSGFPSLGYEDTETDLSLLDTSFGIQPSDALVEALQVQDTCRFSKLYLFQL